MRISVFAVLLQDNASGRIEEIHTGTEDDCHAYVQGYTDALLAVTQYEMVRTSDFYVRMKSPLLSQPNFTLWIREIPESVIKKEENFYYE